MTININWADVEKIANASEVLVTQAKRIADILEKEDVEAHRDTTNLALFGLAQGCANALESMLDDGSMNLLDKSIGLRELVRQWKSMAEVYRKEQEKIDNGQ